MRNVGLFAVAVVLLGITPLMAANNAVVMSIPRPAVVPSSETLPDFIASSILAGVSDTGVLPCFNCIPGASVVTLGVAAPLSVVRSGDPISFTVTGDNSVYSGSCTFAYAVTTSLNSPPVQSGTTSTGCYPSIWIAWFPTTAPAPGRYLVEGAIITEGGAKKTVVTATMIVVNP